MEELETDTSYLLGRYIGVARHIEKELDRLTKKVNPSAIEENFDYFQDNPADALRRCQDIIIKEQAVLQKINRPELVTESAEILKMINIASLEFITLNAPNFLHGYHAQLGSYEQ